MAPQVIIDGTNECSLQKKAASLCGCFSAQGCEPLDHVQHSWLQACRHCLPCHDSSATHKQKMEEVSFNPIFHRLSLIARIATSEPHDPSNNQP